MRSFGNDLGDIFAGIVMMLGIWLFCIALNVAFWGGLIYFAFWCAKHFGVI